jgi:hypothetical protein
MSLQPLLPLLQVISSRMILKAPEVPLTAHHVTYFVELHMKASSNNMLHALVVSNLGAILLRMHLAWQSYSHRNCCGGEQGGRGRRSNLKHLLYLRKLGSPSNCS